jgi:hypothetical protein
MLHLAPNRAIAKSAPSKYLKGMAAGLGSELDAVLVSNVLSRKSWDAALSDNYVEFLQSRTEDLVWLANDLTEVATDSSDI